MTGGFFCGMVLSMSKKAVFITIFLVAVAFSAASSAFAATSDSELNITPDGKVSAKGVKVFQKAGTSFYGRIYWGDVFLRLTVVTNNSTKMIKEHGELSSINEIKEGDMLDVEGVFPSSSDTFIINASYIKNHSLKKQSLETKGTVLSNNGSADEFTMKTYKGNIIKVSTAAADVKRGIIPVTAAQLLPGERVTSARGIYDYSSDILYADTVQVYQNKAIFYPRNFSGKITAISGNSLPLDITVNAEGKDYTVKLSQNTSLLNKNRSAVVFSRFLVGDSVRFYGAIREDNISIIDGVLILRNMSL